MYNPPPIPLAPYPPRPVVKPERGGLLTFVLMVRFIADAFAILVSLGVMSALSIAAQNGTHVGAEGRAAGNLVTMALVVSCIDLAGVAGVLSWKKWGVYLLAGCQAFGLMFQVQAGQTAMAMVGLATMLISGFCIAMRWSHFD